MQTVIPKTYNELAKDYQKQQSVISDLQSEIFRLNELMRLMQKNRFASKSESMIHPGMKLLFEDPNKDSDKETKKDPESKEVNIPPHTRTYTRKPLP